MPSAHTGEQLRAMGAFVPPGLPEEVAATYQAFIDAGRTVDVMIAESLLPEDSREEVRAPGSPRSATSPRRPPARDPPGHSPRAIGVPQEDQEAYEINWRRYQGGFAQLSTRGRVAVADGASDMVHHERPDAVVRAIREVVGELRAPTT
ncbi:MAG TPA: hypothetical protein VHF25_00765 [Nitriliruptorales bacterium]|nr:hypothetical protein [Nitriliruptorales bacterium]